MGSVEIDYILGTLCIYYEFKNWFMLWASYGGIYCEFKDWFMFDGVILDYVTDPSVVQ